MMRFAAAIFCMTLVVGCATKRAIVPTTRAATSQSTDKADFTLDEIEPRPMLAAASQPSTTQSSEPPLDAIALFAEARDAMLQGRRYTAINLLEKAVRLDPQSYELRFWLGQANSGSGMSADAAIAAYESAAKMEPDHISPHAELGRLYLAKGDVAKSIEHLRLALQTRDYIRDESAAALVDFYLAKALQQGGYDRASLDSFTSLVSRLQGGVTTRGSPELSYLAQHPERLFIEIGQLCERRNMHEQAMDFYRLAAERKPGDFGVQAHLVRALAAGGKREEAGERATDIVRQFRASIDSLNLLKEVYRNDGGDEAVARELQRLYRERPDDRTMLSALVEVLNGLGRKDQARQLLDTAARESHYDPTLVTRLFKMYDDAGETNSAAQLILEAMAARPEQTRVLTSSWAQLLRPGRKNHLTIARLRDLEVSPEAQAAKLYWLAELGRIWSRDGIAQSSLDQAVKQVPPFAPAFRALLARYWNRADWDEKQKRDACDALIATVERQGEKSLAAELRGFVSMHAKDFAGAAKQFAQAQDLGGDSIDLRLAYAVALNSAGQGERAEQVMWKIVADVPDFEDAYLQLFHRFANAGNATEAVKVLKTWLANDPTSISAKILEATLLEQSQNAKRAEEILNDLFQRAPDNADVLSTMSAFYGDANRMDEFIAKLEAERAKHSENRTAVEQLVLLYAARKQTAEATRVLDETRAAVANDADLLYYVASLYTRVGQKETAEAVLAQIVELDGEHAPACNDLGYTWAEQNKNLVRAESLVRMAVQKEPDNQAYLDSLGWVLYKRGRFVQARTALEDAIGTSNLPDPIVLDHLGDTLYRLDKPTEAVAKWKYAQQRLGANDGIERDELRELRLQLQQKLQQSEAGRPVTVAPIAEEPAKQAKN